ncbi:uncharacterized protein LOC128257057 [Drosophila gunungcola]|uniref:Uncharacterized protein n=1 Tax=Drosophila gunungcola TaxID=103775 RepID=A0A9Q0BR26_9MUSC|nr:uncharacterized protein LOC128257057 [Drosophila gunungcola]KAI8041467.1 hypothetical protein M5D96_005732 [Drosophila gunungcola]
MSQRLNLSLIVLFCLLALGIAELHIYHPLMTLHHQPTLTHVGQLVDHVPTAVSHQSSTIVHRSVPRITPLLAPAFRTSYLHYPTWSYPVFNGDNSLYRK